MSVKNASQLPKVYYGKHMSPGVAEYKEPDNTLRIFLNEKVIRDMDSSFAGKPVYVGHVDQVSLANLQVEADGYVTESFFNESDGSHWVKFLVVSDKGHDAISRGWRLSNAYVPTSYGSGGLSKGVEYQKEVLAAEYEHLAIVDDPRYEDSIVLTPAQFKEYNNNKLQELKRVANSKSKTSEKKSMFDFFKKTKVENENLEETIVRLPTSGKEVSIAELIKNADKISNLEKGPLEPSGESMEHAEKMKEHTEHKGDGENMEEQEKQGRKEEEKGAAPAMANMDHHVMVGNESKSLKDVMAHHASMMDCMNKLSMHHAEMMKNMKPADGGEADAEKDVAEEDLTKRNADLDEGEKEAEKQEKEEDKTKKNSKVIKNEKNENFKKLQNAGSDHEEFMSGIGSAPTDLFGGVERGKQRYGKV